MLMLMKMMMIVKAQREPPSVKAAIVMFMMNEVDVVDNYDVVDVGDKGSASATETTGWRNKCQGLSCWC